MKSKETNCTLCPFDAPKMNIITIEVRLLQLVVSQAWTTNQLTHESIVE